MGPDASRLVVARSEVTALDWDRRIARAGELESVHPAAAEMLAFYRAVASYQKQIALLAPPDLARLTALAGGLEIIAARVGPAELQTDAFLRNAEMSPAAAFYTRALLEPYAALQDRCPWPDHRPQAGILRPEGYGAKRSLICALCSAEWSFPRLVCPACGEQDFDKLAVYSAPEFAHIRIDACESCKQYIKTVDLTKDGRAEPIVDELAAVSLDIWAQQQGYRKICLNLLGL